MPGSGKRSNGGRRIWHDSRKPNVYGWRNRTGWLVFTGKGIWAICEIPGGVIFLPILNGCKHDGHSRFAALARLVIGGTGAKGILIQT